MYRHCTTKYLRILALNITLLKLNYVTKEKKNNLTSFTKSGRTTNSPVTEISICAASATFVFRLDDRLIRPFVSLMCTKLALLPDSTRKCN